MLQWLKRVLPRSAGSSAVTPEDGLTDCARRIDAWMREGYAHHKSGALEQAETLYRRILCEQQDNADALYLLGQIAAQTGRNEEAIALLEKAVTLNGRVSVFHQSLGGAYQAQGMPERAVESYRRAIELDPGDAEVHNNLGCVLQAQGDLEPAAERYRVALGIDPGLAQAHYNLGTVLKAQQMLDEAIAHFRTALAIQPDYAPGYEDLGYALLQQGRFDEAIDSFEKALSLQPGGVGARLGLGNALANSGRHEAAIEALHNALELKPDSAEAYHNLGHALQARGESDQAIDCYQKALQLNDSLPETYLNLGKLLEEKGLYDAALDCLNRALEIRPDYPEVYVNLSNCLKAKGMIDQAVDKLETALRLKPDMVEAHVNLGVCCHELDKLDLAMAHFRKALELNPDYADAHLNMGCAILDQGKQAEALGYYNQALALKPDMAEAHWNKALALLVLGEFAEGWQEYEWRWRLQNFTSPRRSFLQPAWDGSPAAGHTILLYAEQGLGDALQFIRYAPTVARRCAGVIVQCHPELKTLVGNMPGVKQVMAFGEDLPDFEVQLSLLSVPRVLGTRLESIPADIPYLSVRRERLEEWRERLATDRGNFRVGVVWAGGAAHKGDRQRSCTLDMFKALAEIPAVSLYSLQKGPPAEQARNPPPGMSLIDYTPKLESFEDTAALIGNLDLVISVDTSVAHLAGALGKPVWTLIAYAPDFRWMLQREDSPWYPTMRLFRQTAPGDWAWVFSRVAEQLRKWVAAGDANPSAARTWDTRR